MDYLKIYNDLVESRRKRGKIEGAYGEWHHVKPRCLGGGDELENLVWLTAREHFIAHLLLAVVYGGALWFAAQAMTTSTHGRVVSSRMFAKIREQWAIEMKERRLSKVLHEVVVVETGERFVGTQKEIREIFGLNKSDSSNLARRKAKIVKGIALSETDLSLSWHPVVVKKTSYKSYDRKKYNFRVVGTSEVFTMTRCEFSAFTGLDPKKVSALVTGRTKRIQGYCLADFDEVAFEAVERRTAKQHKFRNIKTGEVYEISIRRMAEKFGLSRSTLEKLVKGECMTYKGFCLDSTDESAVLHRTPKNAKITIKRISDGVEFVGTTVELSKTCKIHHTRLSRLVKGKISQIKGYVFIKYETPSGVVEGAHKHITELQCSPLKSSQSQSQAPSQPHHTPQESHCGQQVP